MKLLNPADSMAVRTFLHQEFHHRQHRNPSYSLRAYARDLGMDAGTLCRILQGKRPVSMLQWRRIQTHFDLTQIPTQNK